MDWIIIGIGFAAGLYAGAALALWFVARNT
jgi:hypothetical protein